jgi:hypothetical protein
VVLLTALERAAMIPRTFKLMAHTWTVEHVPGMFTAPDGDTCRGFCDFYSLTIKVNVAQAPSMVMHTFMHEIMHAVLWSLGNELADNENFVDSVGGALAQVMETAEGCTVD